MIPVFVMRHCTHYTRMTKRWMNRLGPFIDEDSVRLLKDTRIETQNPLIEVLNLFRGSQVFETS